jgi:hypothetical protein
MAGEKIYAYRKADGPSSTREFNELTWKLLSSKNNWVQVHGPAVEEVKEVFTPVEVYFTHISRLKDEGKTDEEIASTLKITVEKVADVVNKFAGKPSNGATEGKGTTVGTGGKPADESKEPTAFEKRVMALRNDGKKNGDIAKLLTEELKPEKPYHHTQIAAVVNKFKA